VRIVFTARSSMSSVRSWVSSVTVIGLAPH
jgi:hypothetical protein